VVLIKNSVTPWIEQGLSSGVILRTSASEAEESKHGKDEILRPDLKVVTQDDAGTAKVIWFETANQAHSSLSTILKPNDVVVFQKDWGDQYI
jgi:myo-inositol-hexaphosphate 3-phosphohydrolase